MAEAKDPNRGLKPFDGMSAVNSTHAQRAEVLDKLLEEPSPDCVKYGFYISEIWDSPTPDYNGDCVKNEINLKNLK